MASRTHCILFVQNAQGIGGSENYLLRLLPALKAKGHEVALAAVHNRWKEGNREEVEGWLQAFRDAGIPVFFKAVFSYLDPGILLWLKRLMHRQQPMGMPFDLVHSHLIYADYWSAMLRALGTTLPSVSTIHGYEERMIERHATCPERVPRDLYWRVLQWSHQRINLTYACSEGLRRFCAEAGIQGAEAWPVVQHGFDFPDLASSSQLDEVPKTERFGDPQLAIVGRLISRKGVHLALKALAQLVEEGVHPHAVVVGRGPQAEALEAQARQLKLHDHVHFVGFDADPQRWMRASDAVLVPSYAEGLPLVVFEAFANGKPVLAFDTIGCADLVEHGKDGLLARPIHAEALAQTIKAFLARPGEWHAMGKAGQQKLAEQYTLDRMVSETEAVYRNTLGH